MFQGGGSGLLLRKNILFNIVNSMNGVLNIPLTVKTRTGIYQGKNVAHEFMKEFSAAGVSLITVSYMRYCVSYTINHMNVCMCMHAYSSIFSTGNGKYFGETSLCLYLSLIHI